MRRYRIVLPLFFGGLLAGCAVGPNYREPTPQVSKSWHPPEADGIRSGNANIQEWWRVFNDDTLSSLVRRAVEGNRNLRVAVLRIREARAQRGIAVGELWPTLDGRSSYQRSRASANGTPGGGTQPLGKGKQFADTVARGIAGSALSQGFDAAIPGASWMTGSVANGVMGMIPNQTELASMPETNLFASGFDASWEIDVFGGLRRNVESADADLAATVEDYRDVLVSLVAEVATTYVDIRGLQAQIASTGQNIVLQKETLSLTRAKFESDLVSELDVRQAETNLASTEAELPQLEAGLAAAIYRMGVLLGREPAAVYKELSVVRDIPQPPARVLVGVPADILRRRPDIRAAERRLASQTAQIGVAAADLYPRFTLSGTFGFESADLKHTLDERSITYGFGPAFRWNLFNGLQTLNRIASQEAAAHRAYASYEQTLLQALQDVETSLVAYSREQVRLEALTRATKAARRSAELAETRYQDGLTDFQDVLIAQRSLVNLENSLAQSRAKVVVDLVALYKALGGGWSADTVPQSEYLEDPCGILTHPVNFILSGGKGPLPWEGRSDNNTRMDKASTCVK